MAGPTIFLIALIVAAAVTIHNANKARHIENIARIEHGIIGDERKGNPHYLLTLGILLCFLGLGFLASYLVSRHYAVPEDTTLPVALFLSGGLGLIVGYLLSANARP